MIVPSSTEVMRIMDPFVSAEFGKSDVTRGFRPGAVTGLLPEGASAFEPFLAKETGQIRASDAPPILQVTADSLTALVSALENACILRPAAGTPDGATDKALGTTEICPEDADAPIHALVENRVARHGTGNLPLAAPLKPIDPVATLNAGTSCALTPQPFFPRPQQLEMVQDIAPQPAATFMESDAGTPDAQGQTLDDSQATGLAQPAEPQPEGVDEPSSPARGDAHSIPVPETPHGAANTPYSPPEHAAPRPSSDRVTAEANPDAVNRGRDEGGKGRRLPGWDAMEQPGRNLGETAAQVNRTAVNPQDHSPAAEARPHRRIPTSASSGANAATDTSPHYPAGQETRDDTGNAVSAPAESQTKAMPPPAQIMHPSITQPDSRVNTRIPATAEVPAPTVAEGGKTTHAPPPQRMGFPTPQASPAPTPAPDLPPDDAVDPPTMPAPPSLDDRPAREAPLGSGLPGLTRQLEAADPTPARTAFDTPPGTERPEPMLPMTDRAAQASSFTQNASGGTPTAFGAPASEVAQSIGRQMTVALAQPVESSVELSLAPEELGKVRMTLHTTDLGITVSVQAERSETLDLMRRHIEQLARDFRELGYAAITFDFGNPAERRQGQLMQRDGQAQPTPPPDLATDLMPATVRSSGSAAPLLAHGLDLRM